MEWYGELYIKWYREEFGMRVVFVSEKFAGYRHWPNRTRFFSVKP